MYVMLGRLCNYTGHCTEGTWLRISMNYVPPSVWFGELTIGSHRALALDIKMFCVRICVCVKFLYDGLLKGDNQGNTRLEKMAPKTDDFMTRRGC